MTAKSRARVIAALPGNVRQLMVRTGFSRSNLNVHLARLRSAGVIHISAWDRSDCGSWLAVHSVGSSRNVPMRGSVERESELLAVGVAMVPAALMAQQRAFPLAGVWA